MYNLEQVMQGITKYIDNEILSKLQGWQKWVYGAGMGIALNKSSNIFNNIKDNKMVQSLEVINEDNQINVDMLYTYFKQEADKGAITFNVIGLGPLTLTSEDVEKLYNYIRV